MQSGKSVVESAKDGSLQQKTAEKAHAAGSAIGSLGQSLFKGLSTISG